MQGNSEEQLISQLRLGRASGLGWENAQDIQGVNKLLCFFLKNFVIFLNSASSAAAPTVFDLPLCTTTDTEGKPIEDRVQNIF